MRQPPALARDRRLSDGAASVCGRSQRCVAQRAEVVFCGAVSPAKRKDVPKLRAHRELRQHKHVEPQLQGGVCTVKTAPVTLAEVRNIVVFLVSIPPLSIVRVAKPRPHVGVESTTRDRVNVELDSTCGMRDVRGFHPGQSEVEVHALDIRAREDHESGQWTVPEAKRQRGTDLHLGIGIGAPLAKARAEPDVPAKAVPPPHEARWFWLLARARYLRISRSKKDCGERSESQHEQKVRRSGRKVPVPPPGAPGPLC